MLNIHIIAGSLALLFGMLALFSAKGAPWHRKAGNCFFITVLLASVSSMYLSVTVKHEFPFYSTLIFYLAVTSWVTIKRPPGTIGRFELGAFLAISALAIGLFTLGMISANGSQNDSDSVLYFFFATVALMAAILDLNMILRGGLTGRHRIARHLWRMCLAMTAGMASFLDQEQFIPNIFLGSGLLWVPLLLMFVLIIFWLIRVVFTKVSFVKQHKPAKP